MMRSIRGIWIIIRGIRIMFNFLKSKPQKPKTLGQLGEEFAQGKYKKHGYKILTANDYNKKGKRLGEIDFIAKNKDKLVFVEVKTRTARHRKSSARRPKR